jgi:hypothetical protein
MFFIKKKHMFLIQEQHMFLIQEQHQHFIIMTEKKKKTRFEKIIESDETFDFDHYLKKHGQATVKKKLLELTGGKFTVLRLLTCLFSNNIVEYIIGKLDETENGDFGVWGLDHFGENVLHRLHLFNQIERRTLIEHAPFPSFSQISRYDTCTPLQRLSRRNGLILRREEYECLFLFWKHGSPYPGQATVDELKRMTLQEQRDCAGFARMFVIQCMIWKTKPLRFLLEQSFIR